MRIRAPWISAILLLAGAVSPALVAKATQYPPGTHGGTCTGVPGGAGCPYPDTLIRVSFLQSPISVPHPVEPDTVWGIGGIITGFDTVPTGFAFYIQNSQGGPWTGVDIFTGNVNYQALAQFSPPLAVGDSVMCYGGMDEFEGGTELRGLAPNAFNPPLVAVRRVSIGNALPPIRRTTVHELYELPTNLAAEQWEGCLVRVKDKMRVVRTSNQPVGIGTASSMLAVDNTVCPSGSLGPCDSLFIDGSTLSFTPVNPLPAGALIDSVQGIFEQRARGFRIQVRSSNDLFDASPPSLADAYFIHNDTLRCVFDRNLTAASANNKLNYTIASTLGPPNAAIRQVSTNIVHLKVTDPLQPGDLEGITVNGLVNAQNGQTMTVAQSRYMYEGIPSISQVQAPDPFYLSGVPCLDRSRFAGSGSNLGYRVTIRGVCLSGSSTLNFLESGAGGVRSGIQVFAPIQPLMAGRQYVIAGNISEFFGETELTNIAYINDEGGVATPSPAVQTIHVLRDTTCDFPGPNLGPATHQPTAQDYEGTLVQVVNVKTIEDRSAGQGFFVAGPYPVNSDTILVDNDLARTFDPTLNQYVTVTGILDQGSSAFGTPWRIQPRGDADIVVNATLDIDSPPPPHVAFAVTPNPARSARITFRLPRRDHVTIAVYDLAGRRLAVLADGEYAPDQYTLDWNGRDASGGFLSSGLYFYRMTVGGIQYQQRGILLH